LSFIKEHGIRTRDQHLMGKVHERETGKPCIKRLDSSHNRSGSSLYFSIHRTQSQVRFHTFSAVSKLIMASSQFPPFPVSGITFPGSSLITSALEYSKEHTTPTVVNHCLRSSAFALIISKKIPSLNALNPEALVLSTLLHDLGWAADKDFISKDKRFEVDGANLAKAFVSSHAPQPSFDLNTIWTSIALHTVPSISLHHPTPEVAATCFGISADFAGPNMPGGLLSVEEYKEVLHAFPRLGFTSDGLKEIMCNLCREKPETTFDNFVGDFGLKYLGDDFKEAHAKGSIADRLMGGLQALAQYD